MHYDLTPVITIQDAQASLLCLAGYLRGGEATPDAACTTKATGILTAYGAQLTEETPGPVAACPCPTDKAEQAALLESAAKQLGSPLKGAINWANVMAIIMAIIQAVGPFIPK